MKETATYKQAKALASLLGNHGVHTETETFEMKTSGIYIPRWLGYSKIPHVFNTATGVAEWYFFLRFRKGFPDINVAEAITFMEHHGLQKLVHKIRHGEK